jgi:cellulose biosynthesis protein BcsQ
MKGGVGKTALTAQIGARLGMLRQNRILIIDIDPQQNLTEIFMNHVAIEQMHQKHKTIVGMFEPGRIDQNATVENLFTFNFDRPLNSGVYTDIVSNFYAPVDKINRISIVLSQFEAIKYTRIDANQAVAAKARFTESIQALKRHFDAILIDCNPSASLLTQCALSVADHILVPVQPDNAARRGLIFTSRALSSFYNLFGKRMHIIFNIVKRRNNEQANIIRWIRDRDNDQIPGISVFNGDIFNSEIPESRALHFPYQTLMPNPAEANFRGFVRPISIGTLPDTRLSELASEIDALLPGGNANAT